MERIKFAKNKKARGEAQQNNGSYSAGGSYGNGGSQTTFDNTGGSSEIPPDTTQQNVETVKQIDLGW